jgi:hypothetical protein
MRIKVVSSFAVATQIILSNICLMPIASAEDHLPVEPMEMEAMQEMAMTPANAMSPLHCDDGCVTIMRPRHHVDTGSMRVPCNDGHCLTEHTEPVAIMTQSSQRKTVTVAMLPVSATLIESTQKDDLSRRGADPSFIQKSLTKTIVMRQ